MGVVIPSFAIEDTTPDDKEEATADETTAYNNTKTSINGLMQYLESLGHETMVVPNGLSCELRSYQIQSLKWCVDQEQLPGGMLRHLWAKVLPQNDDLWFSPLLGKFSRTAPPDVRGGFICTEMGK